MARSHIVLVLFITLVALCGATDNVCPHHGYHRVADPRSKSGFYVCNNGYAKLNYCPGGHHFDRHVADCVPAGGYSQNHGGNNDRDYRRSQQFDYNNENYYGNNRGGNSPNSGNARYSSSQQAQYSQSNNYNNNNQRSNQNSRYDQNTRSSQQNGYSNNAQQQGGQRYQQNEYNYPQQNNAQEQNRYSNNNAQQQNRYSNNNAQQQNRYSSSSQSNQYGRSESQNNQRSSSSGGSELETDPEANRQNQDRLQSGRSNTVERVICPRVMNTMTVLMPNDEDQSTYYVCSRSGGRRLLRCPDGTKFNAGMKACYSSSVGGNSNSRNARQQQTVVDEHW